MATLIAAGADNQPMDEARLVAHHWSDTTGTADILTASAIIPSTDSRAVPEKWRNCCVAAATVLENACPGRWTMKACCCRGRATSERQRFAVCEGRQEHHSDQPAARSDNYHSLA